jgi:protein-S-isoprenylcysteine O-methyltransferase Ste14
MARPTFKKWWTRIVPVPAERSTYVLASNLALIALFVFWQPLPAVVWDAQQPALRGALWALFVCGWLMVLIATFLINHFDLFGLRQVWLHFRGRRYTHLPFATPLVYKHIRHPLYVGWITAFWAIPTMTVGHLLFAAAMSSYILVAIVFEERNLVEHHGRTYQEYRRRTGKLLPRLRMAAGRSTNQQPEMAEIS